MIALILTMKQVAAHTGVSYHAIKSHRGEAHLIWSCARVLSRPDAKRPAYGWLKAEIEKAALNLPRYQTADKVTRAADMIPPPRKPKHKSKVLLDFPSHEERWKVLEKRHERMRLRKAKREAMYAAAAAS